MGSQVAAVQPGHLQVGDDHGDLVFLAQDPEGLAPVAGGEHPEPGALERALHYAADGEIVVYYEGGALAEDIACRLSHIGVKPSRPRSVR